jgi:hypothetical protein
LYPNFSCVNPGIANPWTAPSPCSNSNCSIDAVSFVSQTACDPASDTYERSLEIYYTDAPATGSINVNGQLFPIAAISPTFVTLTNLPADGNSVVYDVFFTDSPNCTFNNGNGWIAPESCNTAGITEAIENPIQIYPNPTEGLLNVHTSVYTSIKVLDINGRTLMEKLPEFTHQINVAHLENGIYFIQTENGATQKFIKH